MASGFRARLSVLVDVGVVESTALEGRTLAETAVAMALVAVVVGTAHLTAATVETELLDC